MAAPDGANIARVERPGDRACDVCGERLEAPYWIVDFPRGAHERCIDWSTRPFPFTRHLEVLRKMARAAEGEARASVIRAGVAMAALHKRWPTEALAVLQEGRAIVAALRPHLDDTVPARLRSQLW